APTTVASKSASAERVVVIDARYSGSNGGYARACTATVVPGSGGTRSTRPVAVTVESHGEPASNRASGPKMPAGTNGRSGKSRAAPRPGALGSSKYLAASSPSTAWAASTGS